MPSDQMVPMPSIWTLGHVGKGPDRTCLLNLTSGSVPWKRHRATTNVHNFSGFGVWLRTAPPRLPPPRQSLVPWLHYCPPVARSPQRQILQSPAHRIRFRQDWICPHRLIMDPPQPPPGWSSVPGPWIHCTEALGTQGTAPDAQADQWEPQPQDWRRRSQTGSLSRSIPGPAALFRT